MTGTLKGDFAGIAANGRSFKVDQGLFAHVRDGKIVEVWEIVDTASLLRQLGVIPAWCRFRRCLFVVSRVARPARLRPRRIPCRSTYWQHTVSKARHLPR